MANKIKEGTREQREQEDKESEQGEINCEDGELGIRKATKLHDPKLPSELEVKEHYTNGHLPYRSWCHHCVRGRGRERDHRKRGEAEESGLPEYHVDYCFRGVRGSTGSRCWWRWRSTPR